MTLAHGIPVPVDTLFFSYWMLKMEEWGGSALIYLQVLAHVCRDKEDPDYGWSVLTAIEIAELTGSSPKHIRRCLKYLEEDLNVLRSVKKGTQKFYLPLPLPKPEGLKIKEPSMDEVKEALAAYPNDPRLKFLFEDTEKKKRKKGRKQIKRVRYLNHPSLRSEYSSWKSKQKDPNTWTMREFLGYYLHKYKLHYGSEDPDFKIPVFKVPDKLIEKYVKDPKALTKKEREKVERDRSSKWKTAVKQIGNFRKHYFYGDKYQMKLYIDFLFEYLDSDDSDWFDGSVSTLLIFREKKNPFIKKFVGAKKKKKKKGWTGEKGWDERHG